MTTTTDTILRKKIRKILKEAFENGFYNHPDDLKGLDDKMLVLFESAISKTREELIEEMKSNDCDCPFHKSDHEWCKSDKQKCGCKGTIFEVEQAYFASLKEKQIKV